MAVATKPVLFDLDVTGPRLFQLVAATTTIAVIASGNEPRFTTVMFAVFAIAFTAELAIRAIVNRGVQFIAATVAVLAAAAVGVAA